MKTIEKKNENQNCKSINQNAFTVIPLVRKVKVPNSVKVDIHDYFSLLDPLSSVHHELTDHLSEVITRMKHDSIWAGIMEDYRDERIHVHATESASLLDSLEYAHMAYAYLIGYVVGMNQRRLTFHTVEV